MCENKLGSTGRRVGCTLGLMSHSKNLTYELRRKREMIRFSLDHSSCTPRNRLKGTKMKVEKPGAYDYYSCPESKARTWAEVREKVASCYIWNLFGR